MKIKIFFVIISIFVLLSITFNGSSIETNPIKQYSIKQINNSKDTYNGYLKIYIVEPSSRWDNFDRDPYHYGFLDFAFNDEISIPYLETYSDSIIWDGTQAGYNNIRENNIFVIAAISNPEINKGYSRPPSQNPFNAFYIDASAGAEPGETDYNVQNEDFTHTVFIEEGTATWCPYCPAMAEALNNVFKSEELPFYFVALVADENQDAEDRLIDEYNIYGYPTAFFDGGYRVLVGGYDDESYYRIRIQQSGQRDVHDLNLSLNVEWIGDGEIEINIDIVNNEKAPNQAPSIPTIEGPTSGRRGREYEYTFSSTDPEGDDVYYWILWFEGCPGVSWDGPYESGETIIKSFSWEEEGTFTIQVKAKDEFDAESDWATLEISMPKSKYLDLFEMLFEYHPILNQILRF